MTEKQNKMILDWMRKIHQMEYAHRYESIYWTNSEKIIGLSAFILSTLVAFSYRFPGVDKATFESLPFFVKKDFLIPLISTVIAILTGLVTFLKPSEKSETHKKTANNYEKLRHKIELLITTHHSDDDLTDRLNNIKDDWESLDAINVQNKFFAKGKRQVKSFKKYPKELDFLDDVVTP